MGLQNLCHTRLLCIILLAYGIAFALAGIEISKGLRIQR
jgi:hypothetical protein